MENTYGLLIDYEYCTGCQSCEVACKEEHDYPVGKTGIKVVVDAPWKIDDTRWNFNNWPLVTDLCDLCADRVKEGRLPTCVHHCQGLCMYYGPVEDLARQMTSSHMVLFTPCEQ